MQAGTICLSLRAVRERRLRQTCDFKDWKKEGYTDAFYGIPAGHSLPNNAHLLHPHPPDTLLLCHYVLFPRRQEQLLEASKTWVGSKEELALRISAALDNPRPFGFIRNLPKTTL